MLAAKNNNELCVQALLKLERLNVAIKDYVYFFFFFIKKKKKKKIFF